MPGAGCKSHIVVPLLTEVFSTETPGFKSQNDIIERWLRYLAPSISPEAIWLFDRGFDGGHVLHDLKLRSCGADGRQAKHPVTGRGEAGDCGRSALALHNRGEHAGEGLEGQSQLGPVHLHPRSPQRPSGTARPHRGPDWSLAAHHAPLLEAPRECQGGSDAHPGLPPALLGGGIREGDQTALRRPRTSAS